MKKQKPILTYILLIAGIIVLVNIVSDRFFLRLDFTADKRYTLSQATKDILGTIKQPITVTGYFSEELPPDFLKIKRDFRELLVEYANRSHGNVMFEFINPNKDEASEQKTMKEGVNPVLINVREKDQVKQQKAYLGAVVSYGDKKEVIPIIQPGTAMEYGLSTSIKKLTVSDKPKIGLVAGHREESAQSIMQVMQALSVLYEVEPVNLKDPGSDFRKLKTLVIINPKDTILPSELDKLDEFLAMGKNIYIAMNRVNGNLQTLTGTEIRTGLEKWLEVKGIKVNPDFIVDQNCGSVMVNQQQGMMSFQSSMQFPYLPMITKFAPNPATKGLNSVLLQFASSIEDTHRGSDVSFTPLASASERCGVEKAPVYFKINRNWSLQDFPRSAIPVAGLLTGRLSGDMNAKLILVSDGDFPVNGEGQQARQIPPDNLNFIVNAIDWLSDDTGLIDLRTREVSSRPLDLMDDGKKTLLKYLNFLLPMILIIGYGLLRWQYRKNIRKRRMMDS